MKEIAGAFYTSVTYCGSRPARASTDIFQTVIREGFSCAFYYFIISTH